MKSLEEFLFSPRVAGLNLFDGLAIIVLGGLMVISGWFILLAPDICDYSFQKMK